jgi:hypothetical protein
MDLRNLTLLHHREGHTRRILRRVVKSVGRSDVVSRIERVI